MDKYCQFSRRRFFQVSSAAAVSAAIPDWSQPSLSNTKATVPIPDDGWRLWPDVQALWQNDDLYLPDEVDLAQLPAHPPTGGWQVLNPQQGIPVTLPASVEQYYWGKFGSRPYTNFEYEDAENDSGVMNGAYRGVSWFWREFELPANAKDKKITLHIRGYRQRVEVFVNRKLAGYDLIAETSYECDITPMLRPGANHLALRITNPGGVFGWMDFNKVQWGKKELHAGRGFGGVDRGILLRIHDRVFFNDFWVLNTPQVTAVQARAEVRNNLDRPAKARIRFSVLEPNGETAVASAVVDAEIPVGSSTTVEAVLNHPGAKLWSPESPALYRMRAELVTPGSADPAQDRRERRFGFRWFEPVGIGSDAMLMLNGERIRLYSAIEFGTWGFNGLWPTPELARKGDQAAKTLGLNALQYHRNLGKHEELEQDDEQGLLRYMEPGGGMFSFIGDEKPPMNDPAPPTPSPIDTSGSGGEARNWSQRYMEFRVLRMIRDHRSHPALVIYNLQNEINPDLRNPRIFHMLHAMHKADPSRTIVFHSGIWASNEAYFLPYDDTVHTEDGSGHSGWADTHTVAGAGVWQDMLYKNPREFTQYSGNRREISMQGEMLGWAAPDNHAAKLDSIRKGGGFSFDRADHERVLSAYERFLDKWDFRAAFPTASALFVDAGNKLYETWGRILRVIRTDDASDYLVINGWEDQPIDSHSGLVDNQRNFKGDPALIRAALQPMLPVVQPRGAVHKLGDSILLDLFLLNETRNPVTGTLTLSLTDPLGKTISFGSYAVPKYARNQFAYLVAESVATPALAVGGYYTLRLTLDGRAIEGATRIFVVDPNPSREHALHVGVLGDLGGLLSSLPNTPMTAEEYREEGQYDLVLWRASGKEEPGRLLERVLGGLPLVVLAQNAAGAEAAAKSLAGAGAFTFDGMAGDSRGCWMGNWVFVKNHPAYDGLPVNQVMKWEYQVAYEDASGLMVDGAGVEVVAGYGRDHDSKLGAATFTCHLGQGKVLFQAVRGMQPLIYERFIRNAARFVCDIPRTGNS